MMSPRLLPAVLAVLLSCACFAVGQPATAPAFLWANTDHLACGSTGQTSRVVYEVLDSDFIGSDLLSGALGEGGAEDVQRFIRPDFKPGMTSIFLGSKLQSHDLGRLGGSEELKPLQSALTSAKSSLSLPHVSVAAGHKSGLLQKVGETVGEHGMHMVGGCGPNSTTLAPGDVTSAVKDAASGKARVLVICAQGTAALSEEMALLQELISSLEQSEEQNMVMYMSDGVPLERAAPRRLQETATKDYTKCDSECMAFVYAIEAGIVLFIVMIAVLTGMACHNMLDAPTKFETPPKNE